MQRVFKSLEAHIETGDKSNPVCDELLGQLYRLIVGSEGHSLDSSIGGSGIATLWAYAFGDIPQTIRHLALRCLTNAVVLSAPMRQIFVEKDYIVRLIELIKSCEASDEFGAFVAARILLCCAGDKSLDFMPYFKLAGLAEAVNISVCRYAQTPGPPSSEPPSAGDEALKLLSTLAVRYPTEAPCFLKSFDPILEMFNRATISSPPLKPPMSSLINCLVTIPFFEEAQTGKSPGSSFNDKKLIEVLNGAACAYSQDELETYLPPLVALLSLIAQNGPPAIKTRLQAQLLPSEKDRTVPLGRGDSLPHRLVKISTESVTPQLKNALASLLLTLSDGHPRQLIHNIGYGCASGLLFSLGLPIPSADGEEGEGVGGSPDINLITGQRLDMEQQTDSPDMTQAEKQREAERMFVLFERLRNSGLVNIENPVRAAARAGQLHEVEEVEESDDD